MNCDRISNSLDAMLLMQYEARLIDTLACRAGADVNGDGVLGVLDAQLVLQFDAGLIDEFPASGSAGRIAHLWRFILW